MASPSGLICVSRIIVCAASSRGRVAIQGIGGSMSGNGGGDVLAAFIQRQSPRQSQIQVQPQDQLGELDQFSGRRGLSFPHDGVSCPNESVRLVFGVIEYAYRLLVVKSH